MKKKIRYSKAKLSKNFKFTIDGVPMLLEKYRGKVEEDIEKKQREAEYLEQRKRAEKELLTDKYSK